MRNERLVPRSARQARLIETHTIDGVAYELYAKGSANKFAASIRVFDVDAGEVVSNTFYLTMEQAREVYAKTIAQA